MPLPYVRKVEYLSPSSFRTLEENPAEFYLQRCGPLEHKPERYAQSPQMAVGSAFDSYVKRALADKLGCPCPSLIDLMDGISPENREEVEVVKDGEKMMLHPVKKGKALFDAYVRCGAFQALLDEGCSLVELEPAHIHVPGSVRTLMGKEVGGVPIMGHPDCLLVDKDGHRVVLDWKVTNAGSPTAGYKRCFHDGDPMARFNPPHEKHGLPMEELQKQWADQLAIYSWLMREGVGHGTYFQSVKVAIDQVVYGGASGVRVAQFRTVVSGPYQTALRDRLIAAWDMIQEGRLVSDCDDPAMLRLTRS